MAEIGTLNGGTTGELGGILLADDIVPGTELGYETAKAIYEFHPLGEKLAKQPVEMAMSQAREITVAGAPEDMLVERFNEVWGELGANDAILRTGTLSRIYGVSALVAGLSDYPTDDPMDIQRMRSSDIFFNCADPLNAAGSLTMNQDASAPDFLKPTNVRVAGNLYHKSRAVIIQNDMPIFLGWTASGFGFTGRSVYQRALYALKSYIRAMIADNLVATKCGLIVGKFKQNTSVANQAAAAIFGQKREKLKIAQTEDILSIGIEEVIESLDLTNIGPTLDTAWTHIRETIAAGAGMPAILVNQQTFAQGFGEGAEDAKQVAGFVEGIRAWLAPLYAMMDRITMVRAWDQDFYETVRSAYPQEYANTSFEAATATWRRNFRAKWPSFLREPESEAVNVDKTRFEAALAAASVLLPNVDPTNKANVMAFVADVVNSSPRLIQSKIQLDGDTLREFLEEQAEQASAIASNPFGQEGSGGSDPRENVERPKFGMAL